MASTLQFVRVIVRLRTNHYAVAQGILAGITMSSPIAIDLASVTQKRPRSERQGADKGEYLGLVHPEDRAFVEQQIQEILATHRAFELHEANRAASWTDSKRPLGGRSCYLVEDFAKIRGHRDGCH